MAPAACRGCGAGIYFLRTVGGKQMPVDASSLTEKDLEYLRGPAPYNLLYRGEEHVSHFGTCPKAGDFQRKGKSR